MKCHNKEGVGALTHAELIHKIIREDNRFQRERKSDPCYLAELWCRLFSQGQESVWLYFEAYYRQRCLCWFVTYQSKIEAYGENYLMAFDEIYNDVLCKVQQKMTPAALRDYESPWALNNYLKRTLWTTTIDYLRKLAARKEREIAFKQDEDDEESYFTIEEVPSSTLSPDEQFWENERAKLLWDYLETHGFKNETERLIIYYRFVWDLPRRGIVRILAEKHEIELTSKKVGDRINYFIQRLRKNPPSNLSALW